ncbi:MAG: alanine racemase, partial [Patescibacteria group bacterium]
NDLNNFLDILKTKKYVKLEAVYSHFANVEDAANNNYAMRQLERFNKMSDKIAKRGFVGFKKHISATAAVLLLPKARFDMVRVGIGQYGLWPSEKVKTNYKKSLALSPVMSWKTRIIQIKQVSKGNFIGYGCSYQAKRNMIMAVLPVGYSDGYDRKLSNKGYVLIGGSKAPIVGRVCMNLTMADITDIKGVKLEDEIVLLGKQGGEEISAEYLADLIGTINYEIVTRINWQIPKIIV